MNFQFTTVTSNDLLKISWEFEAIVTDTTFLMLMFSLGKRIAFAGGQGVRVWIIHLVLCQALKRSFLRDSSWPLSSCFKVLKIIFHNRIISFIRQTYITSLRSSSLNHIRVTAWTNQNDRNLNFETIKSF